MVPSRNTISIESPGTSVADACTAPGASVLVVEDDPDTQSAVAHHLIGCGFEVTVAADGVTAMRIVRETRQRVVYLDMNVR